MRPCCAQQDSIVGWEQGGHFMIEQKQVIQRNRPFADADWTRRCTSLMSKGMQSQWYNHFCWWPCGVRVTMYSKGHCIGWVVQRRLHSLWDFTKETLRFTWTSSSNVSADGSGGVATCETIRSHLQLVNTSELEIAITTLSLFQLMILKFKNSSRRDRFNLHHTKF